ncbi:MAG: phosphopantothenoylcysteine decarboxylase, partial [Saprospiraceae bacterium]
ARRGAQVTLVIGPTALKPETTDFQVIHVGSAQEMYAACAPLFPEMDITVLAAAVADYRPAHFSEQKIKKKDEDLNLALEKTIDIAATLGKQKKAHQLLVGFALETNAALENARGKLERKNLDFIVLNSLQDAGAGFGHDTNKITILRRNGLQTDFELKSKTEVAQDIVDEIARLANPKMV